MPVFFDSDSRFSPNRIPAQVLKAAENMKLFDFIMHDECDILGGKYLPEKNVDFLMNYFYFERCFMHSLGLWVLNTSIMEVKIKFAEFIYFHAEAAHAIRKRLNEFGVNNDKIDKYKSSEIDVFFKNINSADDYICYIIGVIISSNFIVSVYNLHKNSTDSISDAPTVRILSSIINDYNDVLNWFKKLESNNDNHFMNQKSKKRRNYCLLMVRDFHDFFSFENNLSIDTDFEVLKNNVFNDRYPVRDQRFEVFSNTGNYQVADGCERFNNDSYELLRLNFMRSQRDELDAIEAFGTLIWDLKFISFDVEYYLSRITWDESRHVRIGHLSLISSGYNPFELPCRLTGAICRSQVEPVFSMAEISRFGEVSVVKTVTSLLKDAKINNDSLILHIAGYVRRDEIMHVKLGRKILEYITNLSDEELDYKTRVVFTKCLLSLGAISPESAGDVLSRECVDNFIGE